MTIKQNLNGGEKKGEEKGERGWREERGEGGRKGGREGDGVCTLPMRALTLGSEFGV